MNNIEKQKESNILWIQYVYGTILNSLDYIHGALLLIDHYTQNLGYREEDISDDLLEKMFDTDLLIYCYWIATLDGDLTEDENKLITEILPFAYDYETAKKEIRPLEKRFKEMADNSFPSSLGGIATVNDMRVGMLEEKGEFVDVKQEFSISRAYFRLLNMIADTLGCFDGKKNDIVDKNVDKYLKRISNIIFEVHRFSPNEKEYEKYYSAQDDVLGFKPLWECKDDSKIIQFPTSVTEEEKKQGEVNIESVREMIRDYVTENEWKSATYSESGNAAFINFFSSHDEDGIIVASIIADKGGCLCSAFLSTHCPAENENELIKYITYRNYYRKIGFYIYDYDNKQVGATAYEKIEQIPSSYESLDNTLFRAVDLIDDYYDVLIQLAEGTINADQAIEMYEAEY